MRKGTDVAECGGSQFQVWFQNVLGREVWDGVLGVFLYQDGVKSCSKVGVEDEAVVSRELRKDCRL
jgi:hypothetical protein